MSDDLPPPPGPPPADPPGAPPGPPPATPPPAAPGGGPVSENRTVMVVLSYLWILALIPFLVEKEDREVQWHAKHGLVITGLEIAAWILLTIVNFVLGSMIPVLGGCLGCGGWLVLFVGFLVIRIMGIVKGTGGERFLVPGVSEWAEKF